MRQHGPSATSLLFDPLVAALGEWPIAGEVMAELRLGCIDQFLARRVRLVERNIICCHCSHFTGLQLASILGPSFAKLAVSVAGINDRSQRPSATKLILRRSQLSTSIRWAGSPLTMPQRFR